MSIKLNLLKNSFTDEAFTELSKLMEISKKNNISCDLEDDKFRCSYCGQYYYDECDCNGYEDNRGR
jgi:hypothetical protein